MNMKHGLFHLVSRQQTLLLPQDTISLHSSSHWVWYPFKRSLPNSLFLCISSLAPRLHTSVNSSNLHRFLGIIQFSF